MFDAGAGVMIGGFVFSSIGFVAFIYGKRMNLWKLMFCGLALMIYPYFTADAAIMYIAGIAGTAALLLCRT